MTVIERRNMTPWYHFWNPQSGLFGGVMGALILWPIVIFIWWLS